MDKQQEAFLFAKNHFERTRGRGEIVATHHSQIVGTDVLVAIWICQLDTWYSETREWNLTQYEVEFLVAHRRGEEEGYKVTRQTGGHTKYLNNGELLLTSSSLREEEGGRLFVCFVIRGNYWKQQVYPEVFPFGMHGILEG